MRRRIDNTAAREMPTETAVNRGNRLRRRWRSALSILFAGWLLALASAGQVAAEMIEKADLVWVQKSKNILMLLRDGRVVRRYPISLGPNPRYHKRSEGDGRTPEGIYYINGRNPNSQFHLALQISYPNEQDKLEASKRRMSPGGQIMIHGLPNDLPLDLAPSAMMKRNWTQGCVGMTNENIREVWRMVDDGTPVYIEP